MLISFNLFAQQANNKGFTITAQQSVDGKQYKTLNNRHVPYDNAADFLISISSSRRHLGQIGYVYNGSAIEIWQFVGGIADVNFVKINLSGGTYTASLPAIITGTVISVDTSKNPGSIATQTDIQNNIPLTGTVAGRDITGDVFNHNPVNKIELDVFRAGTSQQVWVNHPSNSVSRRNTFVFASGYGFSRFNANVKNANGSSASLDLRADSATSTGNLFLTLNGFSPENARGIIGNLDWSNNITALDFVQKTYADRKVDSARVNAGVLQFQKTPGVWVDQFSLSTGTMTNIYNSNGTLTGPRRINNNGYLLKLDSAKFSIADTSVNAGHLYDFNNGLSFIDYSALNTSSLIQNEISGVKFSTNDRNNLDTANSVWVKPDRVEFNSTTHIDINGKTIFPSTIIVTGTTTTQTINKNTGQINVAEAATSVQVNNNMVSINSIINVSLIGNDPTAVIKTIVKTNGSFTVIFNTPPTNEVALNFWVTN